MQAQIEAIVSALFFNVALVLQAIDARRAPRDLAMRPGLLFWLMRRGLWMVGNGMSAAAAVLQVLALRQLPVAVVQAIGAGGTLIVPISARWLLKERMTPRSYLALAAIVGGLALVMATTPAQEARLTVPLPTLFAASIAIAVGGLVTALRFEKLGTLTAAGVCFGLAGVMSKVVALPTTNGASCAIAIALLIGSGAIGFLAQTTALQTLSPAQVAPVVLAASSALPILVAPMLFSERWPQPAATLGATTVVIAAAAYLAIPKIAPSPASNSRAAVALPSGGH